MLTYEQFLAKHSKSAKWQSLPKSEKKRRYQQYLASPNSAYAATTGASSSKIRSTSSGGGKAKGKTAYAALCEALGLKLSPATHDYLTALYNPFCPRLTSVGFPDGAPNGSQKVRAWARFQVVTNAAGHGYVFYNPIACAAVNVAGVSYSSASTYTGATDAFPPSASGTGQTNINLSGVPYATSSVGATGLMWRHVASGVRIRSTQAMLSKQGECKAFCNPVPDGDVFAVTGSDILGIYYKYAKWYQMNTADTPWFSAIWSPSAPSAGQFVRNAVVADVPAANAIYADLTQAASFGAYSTGLLIAGAPNAVFNCEVIVYYEYFGSQIALQGLTTPSISDPLGVSAASTMATVSTPNAAERTTDGSVSFSSIMSNAASVAKTMSTFLGGSSKDVSSINGMTVEQMEAYLPSVPTAAPEAASLVEGSSLGGFLADAVEAAPALLAMI